MEHRQGPAARRARIASAAAALVLLVPVGSGAGSPARGTGSTQSTLVRVTVGDTSVHLSADLAEAVRNTARRAEAKLVSGEVSGHDPLGLEHRSATAPEDSGTTSVTTEKHAVPGIAEIGVLGASLTTNIADDSVSAMVAGDFQGLTALDGLVEVGPAGLTTEIVVDDSASTVTRTVSIDSVTLFALGDLLPALGVDPHALACGAYEDAGAALGVDASAACEQLAAVNAAVQDGQDALAAALLDLEAARDALAATVDGFDRAVVEADRDVAAALACDPLDAVCVADALATLTTLATTYGVDITGLSLEEAQAAVLAAIDAILAAFAELDAASADAEAVAAAVTDASAGTCGAVSGALASAADAVPALEEALAPIEAELDGACNALRGTTGEVLDAPLVRLDGVQMVISSSARDGSSEVTVEGSVDGVRVGLGEALAVPDVADADATVEAHVAEAISAVAEATGIALPAPGITLFALDSDEGRHPDTGEWFADAALTVLRLELPAATLTVPDAPPLAVLAPAGAASAAVRAAADVPAPATTLDLVTIDVASGFTAASQDTDDDTDDDEDTDEDDPARRSDGDERDLPYTGVAGFGVLPVVLLAAAEAVRRFIAGGRE